MADLSKKALGNYGERLAARHLRDIGWPILATNWRGRDGELDLIGWDPRAGCLAVIEVKTRSGTGFGHPAEAITAGKYARIRRLAAQWLTENPHPLGDVRLDAIAIQLPPGGGVHIEHLKGIEP